MHVTTRVVTMGAVIALTTAALGAAAMSEASAAKPAPAASAAGASAGAPAIDPAAARFGVTTGQLTAALLDAKMASARTGGNPLDPAVIAVVAHDLGISDAQARSLLVQVIADAGVRTSDGADPVTAARLAGILSISSAQATAVLGQIHQIALAGRGVTLANPAFQAVAAGLGITPDQLYRTLVQAKESSRGSAGRG